MTTAGEWMFVLALVAPPLAVVLALLAMGISAFVHILRPVETRAHAHASAMPAFGPLYEQPVFVDVALAEEPEIVFNAGTHTEATSMPWADFSASVRPIVGRFAHPPHDHVGEFRLSYRE